MMPPSMRAKIMEIVDAISTGRFAKALDVADGSRLSEDDLRRVVADYGRRLTRPVTHDWDVVPIITSDMPAWSVRAPLWSNFEGRSDLEVVLSASMTKETAHVRLDDLLVP